MVLSMNPSFICSMMMQNMVAHFSEKMRFVVRNISLDCRLICSKKTKLQEQKSKKKTKLWKYKVPLFAKFIAMVGLVSFKSCHFLLKFSLYSLFFLLQFNSENDNIFFGITPIL